MRDGAAADGSARPASAANIQPQSSQNLAAGLRTAPQLGQAVGATAGGVAVSCPTGAAIVSKSATDSVSSGGAAGFTLIIVAGAVASSSSVGNAGAPTASSP